MAASRLLWYDCHDAGGRVWCKCDEMREIGVKVTVVNVEDGCGVGVGDCGGGCENMAIVNSKKEPYHEI
ncbi:Hypothetical predicted protein [Octopus vulgaris]|uniref:Uncharacterized protein n=1 Tax=Octopus vulgaris TaxID=6645 RepID=A0AA36EYB9_OCTVU|nr:Hypothetical predicted protein [Octopus vulgaris]